MLKQKILSQNHRVKQQLILRTKFSNVATREISKYVTDGQRRITFICKQLCILKTISFVLQRNQFRKVKISRVNSKTVTGLI